MARATSLRWFSRLGLGGLAAVVLLLAGCASRVDWAGRVGTYTYDDAVKEWGPPEKSAVTSDGTTVAEWLLARGQVRPVGPPMWPRMGPYAGFYPMVGNDFISTPDSFLRLTFGPDKKLQAAKRLNK
jgi:hypothetical protein